MYFRDLDGLLANFRLMTVAILIPRGCQEKEKEWQLFSRVIIKVSKLLSYSFASFELSLINDFVVEVMPKYDRVLVVGGFSVQVCCLDKLIATYVLDSYLIDSFNVEQSVSGAKHELVKQCLVNMSLYYLWLLFLAVLQLILAALLDAAVSLTLQLLIHAVYSENSALPKTFLTTSCSVYI